MTIHVRSIASTLCASAKPNRLVGTSAAAGWTSLHLDHHEGAGRGERFETHQTDDLTLVVALAGRHEIEAFSQGRWRSAVYHPGSAGMTPPDESARLRWHTPSATQPFETVNIYLPGSLLADLADEYRRVGQSVRLDALSALSFRDPALASQASALLTASQHGAPDLYAAGAARWLITHLLAAHAPWQHLVDDVRRTELINDRRLARVIEHMSANLGHALTLDDLAREAGISVHHFGRRFREATGMGPATFLTTMRMAHAKMLLRTSDLSVNEIGRRCGYPQASGFATAFSRHAGMTATSYRATS